MHEDSLAAPGAGNPPVAGIDPDDLAVAAEIFRLLADPTRVGLVQVLSGLTGEAELSVGDLAAALGRRPTAISQHLARMRMARLVTTRRQGNTVLYRLANDHVARLVADALQHAEHLGPGTPAHHRAPERPDLD